MYAVLLGVFTDSEIHDFPMTTDASIFLSDIVFYTIGCQMNCFIQMSKKKLISIVCLFFMFQLLFKQKHFQMNSFIWFLINLKLPRHVARETCVTQSNIAALPHFTIWIKFLDSFLHFNTYFKFLRLQGNFHMFSSSILSKQQV